MVEKRVFVCSLFLLWGIVQPEICGKVQEYKEEVANCGLSE